MAQGDLSVFEEALAEAFENWDASDTIKVAILDDTTTPTASDATPALGDYTEVGTAGTYAAGGTSLGTWGDFVSEVGGTTTFDSTTNPSWSADASNDADAHWALVYNDTQAGDPAFAFVDLGGPVDMSSIDLNLTWNASGLADIS